MSRTRQSASMFHRFLYLQNRNITCSITVWRQFALVTTAYGVHFLNIVNPSVPKLLWNLPLDTISGKSAVFKDCTFFPTQEELYVLRLKNSLDPQWVFHAGHIG